MKSFPGHERRWGSDTVPSQGVAAASSSSGTASPCWSAADSAYAGDQEFVEVTLDLQDDETIILRSVEPATSITNIDIVGGARDFEAAAAPTPGSSSASRSPATGHHGNIRRSSSSRLRQFSQELKAEAVAKARQFSQELRRFSRSHSQASKVLSTSAAGAGSGRSDTALAARALRRQRAQLDRTRSGAQKALRGLRFISNRKNNGVDAWNEVQANFDKLANDGYLYRAEFAQCIGLLRLLPLSLPSLIFFG